MIRPHTALLAAVALAMGCSSSTAPPAGGSNEQPSSSSSGGTSERPKPPDLGPTETPAEDTAPWTQDPILDPKSVACSGAPGELYELSVRQLAVTDEIPLCRAKGRVLLVVNGASHCGFTPQYKPLQELYLKHKEAGLSILAFPSKSFNQEDSNEQQVSDFCTKENGITFPLFAIGPVKDNTMKGEVAQPVYKWLAAQPSMSTPVAWNFEKFLIGRDGKVVKRFLSGASPAIGGPIDQAIMTALSP
jgi:glutathione peroxidase-family protein